LSVGRSLSDRTKTTEKEDDMSTKIEAIWEIDGEICVRGEFNGREFQLVHCDTEIDYGWHCINYLPQYSEYRGIDDECDEWDDLLNSMDITLLKAKFFLQLASEVIGK